MHARMLSFVTYLRVVWETGKCVSDYARARLRTYASVRTFECVSPVPLSLINHSLDRGLTHSLSTAVVECVRDIVNPKVRPAR